MQKIPILLASLKRYMRHFALFSLFSANIYSVAAQPGTTIFTEANLAYKRGMEFYEKGLFGKAQIEFQKAIDQVRPQHEPESAMLKRQAELNHAKCAVMMGMGMILPNRWTKSDINKVTM